MPPVPFLLIPHPTHRKSSTISTKINTTEGKMKFTAVLMIAVLLAAAAFPPGDASRKLDDKQKKGNGGGGVSGGGTSGGNQGGASGFGPYGPGGGAGFGIPGFGGRNGWGNMGGGYGAGYGGPGGGYARGGVIRPTVVCSDRGPCYKKKLSCPAKCFNSYSRSGKNYGAGGGGGSCTIDCKKHCVAYC